jgi:hypothetical protein
MVKVDLGEYVITRRWTTSGSTLSMQSRDGAKVSSPQKVLDGLIGKLSFDPLAFTREDSKKQLEMLRKLVGVDTSAIEQEEATAFAERTAVTRDVKALAAQVDGMPLHKDVPEEPVDTAKEAAALEEVRKLESARLVKQAAADKAKADAEDAAARADVLKAEIEAMRALAVKKLAEQKALVASADLSKANAQRLALEAQAIVVPDASAILQRIRGAQETNAKVAANQRRSYTAEQLAERREQEAALTAKVEAARAAKQAAIAAAKFPVPGMGLGDSGITLNGLPFEQASSAEQLRVSVAIGIAMNPKIRVLLLRDGSLLDKRSMAELASIADERGVQIWVEHVGTDGPATVVIEDGHVVGDLAAAE